MFPRLLLVAGHDDDLDLPLHHQPPPVIDCVGERALAGDVGIAAAGALDVVGIDVVTARHPRVLGQHHPAVVEREDVLVPVLLPVSLTVSFRTGEVIFVLKFFTESF